MSWGAIMIGSLVLKETDLLEDVTNANTGVRTVRFEGAETATGTLTQPDIAAKQADIMGLIDRTLPVVFERKTEYNGYYRVTDTNTALEKWQQGPGQVRWSLAMELVGPDNAVDLESRLANVVRANDFSLAGERWHAPPIGHYGYYTGPASPTQLVRQASDGPITVYRGVPAGISPRWGCAVGSYPVGRVRFLSNTFERTSPGVAVDAIGWELLNGLVRLKPGPLGTTFLISFWDGTAWRERAWDVRTGADTIVPATHFRALHVVRRDAEVTVLRILAAQPDNGARVLIDLTLRRGARFVEFYVQRTASGDITVVQDVVEPATTATGYMVSTGEDDNSIRSVVGTARTFTAISSGPGLTKVATTAMDFWIGAELLKPSAGGANAGLETGSASPWVATLNSTLSTVSPGKFGTFAGRMTVTAASPAHMTHPTAGVVGAPTISYTLSGWLKSSVSLAAGVVTLSLMWYNGGTFISENALPAPALAAGVWVPVSVTATAPASTTNIGRKVTITGTPAAGSTLDWDQLIARETNNGGETPTALRDQYIGAMAEKVGVVKR